MNRATNRRVRTSTIGWVVLSAALCVSGCNEKKKDLSPPPLNPHPKEAVHIRVSFDNPEDAKRYTVTLDALYQNQQRECGYIGSRWAGNFVYPSGQFEIPNESQVPGYGEFTIYLDRYNRETCNWEFSSPGITIRDSRTGWFASTGLGGRGIFPGMKLKETCTFISSAPNMCWREDQLTPERKMATLVPITIRVLEDSAQPGPHQPGFFSNFLEPMNPANASSAGSHDSSP